LDKLNVDTYLSEGYLITLTNEGSDVSKITWGAVAQDNKQR